MAGDPGFERNKLLALAVGAAILPLCAHFQRPSKLALAIFCALFASTLLALDSTRAFIGSLERSQGTLVYILLAVFAMARLPWPMCRFWIAIGALVCSVWALLQLSGLEQHLFGLAWMHGEPTRVFAGFGNPTALGGFLVLALPVCVELALKSPRRAARILGWLASGLGVITLIASGTRAAMLGLVAAVLIVFWWRTVKYRALIGSALLAGLLLCAVLLFNTQRSASVFHRLAIWENAAQAIIRAAQSETILNNQFAARFSGDPASERLHEVRFWLGFGADLQAVPLAAERFKDQIQAQAEFESARVETHYSDRAHNLVLDGLLEFGLIGTVLLLLWASRGVLRLRGEPWRLCAVLAGLLSWQAGFSLTAEKLVLVLLLCAASELHVATLERPNQIQIWRMPLAALLLSVGVFCFGPWLGALNENLRQPEAAFACFQDGTAAFKAGQFELAQQRYGCAAAFDPWRLDYRDAWTSAGEMARARQN